MNMYVGITEKEWYLKLKDRKYNEVVFTRSAGNINFSALERDELFLFKLHSPENYIVGGGYFLDYAMIPDFNLWDIFKEKTGATDFQELRERFSEPLNSGAIILRNPFFLEEEDWIPVPEDWNSNIGHGKIYNIKKEIGRELHDRITERIAGRECIREYPLEGAVKIKLMDSYNRSCSISGSRALPALTVDFIRPLRRGGSCTVDNGIVLRKDFMSLFKEGYIAIEEDYTISVSDRIQEDFGREKDYLKLQGRSLSILPERIFELPSKSSIKWHRENIYKSK